MTGVLDRQEVIAVLDEYGVGQRALASWDSYRELIADALMALAQTRAAFVQVRCTDTEDYARIFNEGFAEAQRQCEADVRTAGAAALKEAAAEQRRLSEDARTNNGQAEHEDIADWLEERADAIPGRTLHCPVGCEDGVCETCPCCSAGFCVYGLDGLPEDPEDVGAWLQVAAAHNPVAALLATTHARILDAHPSEPAPVVTDEAVEDLHARVVNEFRRHGQYTLADSRAALEAAAPLLGPRPLLDREAVKLRLQTAQGHRWNGDTAADAVMELARPLPTQEQIEAAILPVIDQMANSADEIAGAVLALLNGAEA